jgi:hypothetical protein
LTPASAGAAAARATPDAIKAPTASFVIVLMFKSPSGFFEPSQARFRLVINMAGGDEPALP